MRVLLVHPSALMYSEVYLRLEPLGLERVAEAIRQAGHTVRLVDLQVFDHAEVYRQIDDFAPHCIGFSLNYLANIPEVIDLSRAIKQRAGRTYIFAGGHSVSFIAEDVLAHADGAIDCIITGEGETTAPRVVEARGDADGLPGTVTRDARGPRPQLLDDLDRFAPARDLARRRHRYFIGVLDPCASIEFTRGCPWDCSFCSAWTFYGRSYRKASPEAAAEEMATIREPNAFIVDDVAFVHEDHGMAIADELDRRRIRKQYYLETRCDVLIRNEPVFKRWKDLGLTYMFLGFESLNEDQLRQFRKRVTPNENFKALEVARRLGVQVAINLITNPSWDEADFRRAREWAMQVPEIVHLTVATPYPGTELFHTDIRELSSRDYRLFDVQHAVLPTKLPLRRFYELLVETQATINRKHLGWKTALRLAHILAGQWLRGQFNTTQMLFRFNKVFNPQRQYGDHHQPVNYELRPAGEDGRTITRGKQLYVHQAPVTVSTRPGHTPTGEVAQQA